MLITGGAGFIGSHIADKLLQKNFRVIVLDNLSTDKKINIPRDAIFIKGDVRSKHDVEAAFDKHKIDIVLHIAGQASTVASFKHPLFDVRVNFLGTVNVVQACLKHNVERLLYASSMAVYGNPSKMPVRETYLAKPVSYYGISKHAAENFVHATCVRTDLSNPLNATSFRMFNVYGPRQSIDNPYQGALAIFIGNTMRNEPITVYGDGEQTRDFVYIEDVVNAWLSAIDNKRSFGKVFNIGFGRKVSINSLAREVIKSFGLNPQKIPYIA